MREKALIRSIIVDLRIMLGKAVIKGTRLPVDIVVEKIAFGATFPDLKRDYPFPTEEDMRAALLYAAKRVASEEVYAP